MKTKLFLSITTGLLFFSLISCKSIKEMHPEQNLNAVESKEDAIVRSLKFKPLTEATLRNHNENNASVGIVRIRFGRPSKNCNGFGICETEWFPGWREWIEEILMGSTSFPNTLDAIIKIDNNGEEYITIELSENPSFKPEELSLIIERDLEMPNSGKNAFKAGKLIESGEYKFSKNIGKFGGYRIPLKNYE